MSHYSSKSSNPFEEEDDDFVVVPKSEKSENPFADRRQQLSRMVDESEERQLESTQRALASLNESEAMGNATAEELLRQREVIQNIERKTDEINSTLTTSQRHLNNIKSVFGGVKNWWGRKKSIASAEGEPKTGSSLDSIVEKNQDSGCGSGEGRGWDSREVDLDNRFGLAASHRSGSMGGGSSSLEYVQPITRSAREEEMDRNLGVMSEGLGRLKTLALGLGDEIEQQNEALDRLQPKVDRSNVLLDCQLGQMNKILK